MRDWSSFWRGVWAWRPGHGPVAYRVWRIVRP